MSNDVFAKEIRKTGFVLENAVAQQLKAAGWTVISNKYYVDDSEEAVREIDIVAYRVSKVQHFDAYTVLKRNEHMGIASQRYQPQGPELRLVATPFLV